MKIQKRLLAAFLAASMVFTFSTAAFAEDNSNAVTSTGTNATADKDTENKVDITVNGTYLSELESDTIISVNVAWTDMNFEYAASQQGTWDPTDHTYGGAKTEGEWLKDSATIIVTNHSNENIIANLSYEKIDSDVTGTLTKTALSLDNAAKGASFQDISKAPSEKVGFKVSGAMNSNGGDLGTITVAIEKNLVLDLTGVDTDAYATTIEKFATKNGVTKLRMILGTEEMNFIQGSRIKQGCQAANVTEITILDVTSTSGSGTIFERWDEVTAISMPKLTKINESFVYRCDKLETIDLPELVTTTDMYVINECAALKEIYFPNLTTIKDRFISECDNITTINLPNLSNVSGDYTFDTLKSLKTVNLPNLTNTVDGMFYLCTSLENITLPKVENVATEAFLVCSNLKNASFPKATSIGRGSFNGCDQLQTLSFGTVLTSADGNAFFGLDTKKVNLTLNAEQTAVSEKEFSWDDNIFDGTTFKSIQKAS